jgi:hypothetical protein
VFLVGDFNARHPSWDAQYRDATYTSQQGKWLHKQLIAYILLVFLNYQQKKARFVQGSYG